MDNRQPLPDDITKFIILKLLPVNKLGLFSITSKNAKKLTHDALLPPLLHYVAYGNQAEAENILKLNPALLLERATTTDPAGNTIENVTALECALGACDVDMVAMMTPYFSKLEDGDHEKAKQFKPYKLPIEQLMSQTTYDFKPLFDVVKSSFEIDIVAALNKNIEHKSDLSTKLTELRNTFKPSVIKTGEMHYNYTNLISILKMLDDEWNNLRNGDNHEKNRLIWQQGVGWIMRGLPACDRQAYARGLYRLLCKNKPLKRSFKLKDSEGDFPVTAADTSLTGLGWDFAVEVFSGWTPLWAGGMSGSDGIKKLMSNKIIKLTEMMQPKPKSSWCVIS